MDLLFYCHLGLAQVIFSKDEILNLLLTRTRLQTLIGLPLLLQFKAH